MKIIQQLLITISLALCFTNLIIPVPAKTVIPFPEAQKMYANNPEALEKAKQEIIAYHTAKDGLLSGYEEEITIIIAQALHNFTAAKKRLDALSGQRTPAIILDIDETVLSNLQLRIETNFASKSGCDENYIFRDQQRCTGIKPMVDFCKKMRELNYKLIFISSRRGPEDHIKATKANLIRENIQVDEIDGLFLMPVTLHHGTEKMPVGNWKESVRQTLSCSYDIVGCIGDHNNDISGNYIGEIQVKLPNYLY